MMNPCNKCLDNYWKYEYNEGYIIATCQMCGNEIMFMSKKLKRREQMSIDRELLRKSGNK